MQSTASDLEHKKDVGYNLNMSSIRDLGNSGGLFVRVFSAK